VAEIDIVVETTDAKDGHDSTNSEDKDGFFFLL